MKTENTVWHQHKIGRHQRAQQKAQKPCLLWFTGLSGSGKSTIANAVDELLFAQGKHTYVLDGDNIRHGLNGDLGFSDNDRIENIRRIGEVAKLFVDAGLIVTSAFISPFAQERDLVRKLLAEGEFIEVFIDTPIEVCEQRDPKGLYKKARAGEIAHFTGISSDYHVPQSPQIHVQTKDKDVLTCARQVLDYLVTHGYFVE